MTAVAFALLLASGHGLLRLGAGRWPHRAYGPVGAAGLSFLAGVAALGTVTTLVGVLGGPTRPLPVTAPVLVGLALAGLLPRLRPRPRSHVAEHRAPADPGPPERAGGRGVLVGDAVAAVLAIAVTARVAVLSAPIPVHSNDEYALWMLRARALSDFGGLDPRVFTDTGAGYQHLDYPIFLPALFGWLDGWPGGLGGAGGTAAAHVAVAAMLGALIAVTGAVLTRLAGPAAATAALLLVVSVPTVLGDQSLLLMADLPELGFALGLALVLLRWLALPRGDAGARAWLAAAAVLGAGAVGTKAEGAAFAGSAFLAALVLGTGRRRPVLLAGALALAANLPWRAYVLRHQLHDTVINGDTLTAAHLREMLPWTGTVVRTMARQWPGGSGTGLLLLAAAGPAAVLAVRAGAGRLVLFLAVVVGIDTAVLAGQYVLSALGPPSDPGAAALENGLLRVTVYRVAVVPAALLALAVPVLAGLALADRPAPAPDPVREPQAVRSG